MPTAPDLEQTVQKPEEQFGHVFFRPQQAPPQN